MTTLFAQRWRTAGWLAPIVLAAAARVEAATVEGVEYPDTANVAGTELKLVGAGLRQKWFFDVYTMGAYSQSGTCDPDALSRNDEPKYLRIDMLRDVSGEKLASALKKPFAENMPGAAPQELAQQVQTFLSYFQEAKKGTRIELTYIPGQGTRLQQDGKAPGPAVPGKPFADLLWTVYFGKKTCCADLKKQVLQGCSQS